MFDTNNKTGRNLAVTFGLYMIVKAVVNMIIGGDSIAQVVYAVIAAVALYTGLQFVNYVIAASLALVVLMHIGNNIANLGTDWRYVVYILEGVIDAFCAVMLVINVNVREHFTNKWTEIGKK